MIMVAQVIDIVIAVLLLGAIGFGIVVDRRVRKLRDVLTELQPAVEQFSSAVDRTETQVVALRGVPEAAANLTRPAPTLAPTPAPAADRSAQPQAPSFRSRRMEPGIRPVAAAPDGKSDLVRSFFETARGREA